MIGRRLSGILAGAALIGAAAVGLEAQANVEDQARRQLESGREFFRNGKYTEALKDFQTVAEGYPTSSVADDALLAIAMYQLEIQRDPATARTTADSLIKKYATSDSAPMGYVVMGRATMELEQTPAGLDSALASFDRVPRLFPSSDAVAPALYWGAEVDRRAGRRPQALDRLRDLSLQYPRSVWAARSALLEARLLVTNGEPQEAMRVLQRVVRGFGTSDEAATARAWNTTLYRLTIRPPADAAYGYSGRSLAGQSGRFRDVASISLGPDGRLGIATRAGILLLDDKGAVTRQAPATDPRQFTFDRKGLVTIFERGVLMRETDKGMQRMVLTAATPAGPKILEEISAGAPLTTTGEYVVADRGLRGVYRFNGAGQFVAAFASGRVSKIAVSLSDQVAMIDSDTKSVIVADHAGKTLLTIPQKGTGYEMGSPADIGFDMFEDVYVLDKERVLVFGPNGKLLTIVTPDPSGAFKNGQSLTLDSAARLYVYDEALGRVLIYQ
jgi:outer membrane protein assembly factor BamD (BamD/ComL family)